MLEEKSIFFAKFNEKNLRVNSQSKFHSGNCGGSYPEKDFVVEFSLRSFLERNLQT